MKTFVNILFGIFAGITIASYLLTRNQSAQPVPAQATQSIPVKADLAKNNNLPKLKVPASTKSASLR